MASELDAHVHPEYDVLKTLREQGDGDEIGQLSEIDEEESNEGRAAALLRRSGSRQRRSKRLGSSLEPESSKRSRVESSQHRSQLPSVSAPVSNSPDLSSVSAALTPTSALTPAVLHSSSAEVEAEPTITEVQNMDVREGPQEPIHVTRNHRPRSATPRTVTFDLEVSSKRPSDTVPPYTQNELSSMGIDFASLGDEDNYELESKTPLLAESTPKFKAVWFRAQTSKKAVSRFAKLRSLEDDKLIMSLANLPESMEMYDHLTNGDPFPLQFETSMLPSFDVVLNPGESKHPPRYLSREGTSRTVVSPTPLAVVPWWSTHTSGDKRILNKSVAVKAFAWATMSE